MGGSSASKYGRRKVLKGVGVAGVAGLAGCVGTGNQESSSGGGGNGSADSGGQAKMANQISVWGWDVAAKSLDLTDEPYEKAEGGKVNVRQMGHDSLVQKYKSRLLSGTGAPAASVMESQTAPAHISTNGLLDIADRIEQAGLKEKFVKGKWQSLSKDGGIYALPWDLGPVAVFYRRDIYEQAGIDPSGIGTWDEFIEAGKQLPEGTDLFNVNSADYAGLWRVHYRMLGGQAFTADGKVNIASEKSVRVARMLKKAWDAGVTANMETWSQSWFSAAKEGSLVALPSGAWMEGTLKDSLPDTSGKWGVHRMPPYDKGSSSATNSGGSNLVISKQVSAGAQERAWSYMKFALAGKEMQLKMYENFGIFPALKSTYEAPLFNQPVEFFDGQKIRQIFADVAPNVPGYRYTKDTSVVEDMLNNYLDKMFKGSLSPEAAVTKAAENVANRTDRELA